MNKYSSALPEVSGTGGELAEHLIKKFSLKKSDKIQNFENQLKDKKPWVFND